MTTIEVPTKGEVSEKNQAIFDQLKTAVGMVPNLYATMAHSESALANYIGLQGGKTSFSNKEKEAVNLVVSQVNGCNYCQAAHTTVGKMNGFTEEQTIELRKGNASWDPRMDALVKLTKVITETKGKAVENELADFFSQGYTKGGLIDLILLIADKVVMNYLHNITQVEIDFPAAPELETAVA